MLHSLLTLLFAFPSPTADYAAIVASFLQPRRALLKPALLLAALKAACIDTSNPAYITHVLRVLSLLIESCDALFSCLLVNHFVLSRLLRFFRSNPADALAVPAVKCALSIIALERRFHPRASCAFAFSVLNEMVTVRILAEVKPAAERLSAHAPSRQRAVSAASGSGEGAASCCSCSSRRTGRSSLRC